MKRSVHACFALALAGCQPEPPRTAAVVPAEVVVRPASVTLTAGESQQLSAQVNDAVGRPIGGAAISFETGDSRIIRVSAAGLASSTGVASSARVVVSSGGRQTNVPITVMPGLAARLERIEGDGQVGTVNGALPRRVAVRVADSFGNPDTGTRVQFSTEDGGAVVPTIATADEIGVASGAWTLGPKAGIQRVTASVRRGPVETFTATAEAGEPARMNRVRSPRAAAPSLRKKP
jgi:hypothetical protein